MVDGRRTVCVDFDGVIHRYISPWTEAYEIHDGPVDGAIEWLLDTSKHYTVVIHTTRARSVRARLAIREWLAKHGLGRLAHTIDITNEKVPAMIYIDDRGWRFEGTFPSVAQIKQAYPWNHAEKARNR